MPNVLQLLFVVFGGLQRVPDVDFLQGDNKILVVVFVEGVNVGSDCPAEKHRILRDDRHILSEVVEPQILNVLGIKRNAALVVGHLQNSQQS